MKNKNQIIIYQSPEGEVKLDVKLQQETVWLSQKQMGELFNRDYKTISKHVNNVFREGELDKTATVAYFATVQNEGGRRVSREIEYYNLDAIISVGYRVKSRQGTQFRIWANNILKDYLVKGYAINEKRLKETQQQLSGLKQTIKLLENVANEKALTSDEATGLLKVVADYTHALDILDKFDLEQLTIEKTSEEEIFRINYQEARRAIDKLKEKFGGSTLFGHEKDESFKSSLSTVYQTFDGTDLYPSIEEKAAHLLYFIVKNHSFSDGNKRIAAFVFVWFLDKNNLLYHADGHKRIADNALVALTLMIAQSNPAEKEIMTKVIVNLINKNN